MAAFALLAALLPAADTPKAAVEVLVASPGADVLNVSLTSRVEGPISLLRFDHDWCDGQVLFDMAWRTYLDKVGSTYARPLTGTASLDKNELERTWRRFSISRADRPAWFITARCGEPNVHPAPS